MELPGWLSTVHRLFSLITSSASRTSSSSKQLGSGWSLSDESGWPGTSLGCGMRCMSIKWASSCALPNGLTLDLLLGKTSGTGLWKGTSFHFALQTGQIWFPCFTLDVMQWKWKEWEHSAVNIACPAPGLMEVRHIEHVFCKNQGSIKIVKKCQL